MRNSTGKILLVAGALLLAASTGVLAQTGPNNLTLSFENLATLDEGVDGHYEGWAIVDGSPVSTGKFNVNAGGLPVELGGGAVIDEFDAGQNIMYATDIKISIEPVGDVDALPSGLIIVEAAVLSSMAELKTAVPGLDMLETMTSGDYILATPSDNDTDAGNDDQGIWWLTMPGPEAGLMYLPDLGANWVYEGWVVDVSGGSPVPYSTGTFATASGFDSDAAGCMGGGPPFPGQDFVAYQCDGVLDLDSGDFAAVISIEPVPDNGAGPFLLKPLAGGIPTDALGQNNSMGNQVLATFPTGMGAVFGSVATEETSWTSIKTLYR